MTDTDPRPIREPFLLDPEWDFLNHGSFGACPRAVLDVQADLRQRMEHQPVRFLDNEHEALLDGARRALAAFVGADPEGLAFVPNATTGVNAVLRSLPLGPGDALLVTDHAYGACRNALDDAAVRAGARVVVARIPFPLADPAEVVDAVLGAVVPGTRLALIDHVTSPTGLVLPVAGIVEALQFRGIDALVDGAHAPGMVPLDVRALGAAYYTGNCHKWLCAPKGAGFLWVRPDRRDGVRPVVISHGATSRRTDRSRFLLEFDWVGTGDPTAFLSVPAAIGFMGTLLPGGWPALMGRNRALALRARDILCAALDVPPPCPDAMIGSLAAVPLPDRPDGRPRRPPLFLDPLQEALQERTRIEVPVMAWPAPPRRLLRVSAQAYNAPDQYVRLADTVRRLLAEGL
jgi:isopenicillin-N epimerase